MIGGIIGMKETTENPPETEVKVVKSEYIRRETCEICGGEVVVVGRCRTCTLCGSSTCSL